VSVFRIKASELSPWAQPPIEFKDVYELAVVTELHSQEHNGTAWVLKLFRNSSRHFAGYSCYFTYDVMLAASDGESALRGFNEALSRQATSHRDFVLKSSSLLSEWYDSDPLSCPADDDPRAHYLLISDATWLNLVAPPDIEPEWFVPSENSHILKDFGLATDGSPL
jgi:hypothetical protein